MSGADPPAADPPFRGQGAAGGFWVVTLVLLAAAAFFVALGAAILLQMELDPVDPPPPDVEDEGDGRSWRVLGANILALFSGMGAFVTWVAAVGLAAAGRGRLAKPVLALGAAVFLALAAMFTLTLRGASAPGLVGLLASLLGAFASVVAWRRPPPASGEAVPAGQA